MTARHLGARGRLLLLLALLVGLLAGPLAAPPGAALAVEPFTVDETVVDRTGRVDRVDEIEQSAQRLRDETGMGFHYIVVDRFDDPSDGFDWATAVAERSGLGDLDTILYVGVDQLEFGLNVGPSAPLTTAQIRRIEDAVRIQLDRGELGRAGVAAADGLREELQGADGAAPPSPTAGADPVPSGDARSGGLRAIAGLSLLVAVPMLFVLVFGVLTVLIVRSRTRRSRRAEEQRRGAQLEAELQEASQQLVRSDNLVHSAQEELGFAEAGFGAEISTPLRRALERAQEHLREAFALQARLLDEHPDTLEERESWTREIRERTAEIDRGLQAELDRLTELRAKQEHAPMLLDSARQRLDAAAARFEALRPRVEALRADLDPAELAPIGTDLEQAGRLLDLARDEVGNAAEGVAAGRLGPAVIDIGDAEVALAQYGMLDKSLEETLERIATASAAIAAETTRLRQALGALQQLHREADGRFALDPQLPGLIADTTRLVEAVAAEDGRHRTPLATLHRLRTAAAAVDTALSSAYGAKEQYDHAVERLPHAVAAARAAIDAANVFITTRRGAISATPRTRLDQSMQALTRAESLAAGSPVAALAAATESLDLAQTALASAQREVDAAYAAQYSQPQQHPGYGDYRQGYGGSWGGYHDDRARGQGFGEGLADAIIGGIVGGILSGGGGSRRGDRNWGGSSSRSSRGGSSSSWSSGSRSSRGGSSSSRSGFRSSGSGFRASSGGGFRSSGGGRSSGGFRSSGGGRRR